MKITDLKDIVFPFIFAVYWGAMISGMDIYKVFHVWTVKRTDVWHGRAIAQPGSLNTRLA